MVDVSRALGTDYYVIEELLTDEERKIRERVCAFYEKEVISVIGEYWDRAEFPFALFPKLADLNIMSAPSRATAASG